jgi:hypothetical protein
MALVEKSGLPAPCLGSCSQPVHEEDKGMNYYDVFQLAVLAFFLTVFLGRSL